MKRGLSVENNVDTYYLLTNEILDKYLPNSKIFVNFGYSATSELVKTDNIKIFIISFFWMALPFYMFGIAEQTITSSLFSEYNLIIITYLVQNNIQYFQIRLKAENQKILIQYLLKKIKMEISI